MKPEINNFRYIYGEPKKEKSEFLEYYSEISGYTVYTTTVNPNAYIIYDEDRELYFNFERLTDNTSTLEQDIEAVIRVYVNKNDE